MSLEVMFLVKKQRELATNFIKKEAIYNFLKEKDGLTDKEKIVLKNIGKCLKKLNNDYKNVKIILHMA